MNLNQRIEEWLKAPFDRETQIDVEKLKQDTKLLEDAFYTDISFGTGGMRGKMGVGPNRINKYTLGKASQGLSNYLNALNRRPQKKGPPKIVIAYDSRHNSKAYAELIAGIFSANTISTYLFDDLRPTPMLSFAVRHLQADAGIVLTASHNPPEYNGYKVYNQYGGQITPPEDEAIIDWINKTQFKDIRWEVNHQHIHTIGQEIDKAYETKMLEQRVVSPLSTQKTRIVFSPLHGTAIKNLPPLLKLAGYDHCSTVLQQSTPDGNFPTVCSPNPEDPEAFQMAIEQGDRENANLIMATDPDADRIGICVKNNKGQWQLLNGNQLMTVLVRFVLENKKLNPQMFVASTIVSTPLIEKISAAKKIECLLTLTGFKWIGKLIQDHPEKQFLCGGEESYGFLLGDQVRDKDAISTALLIADLHAHLQAQGKTIQQYLLETYLAFGLYHETLVSMTKEGKKGQEEIQSMMTKLRFHPPQFLDGTRVTDIDDYLSGENTTADGKSSPLDLPKANVLRIHLEDGSRVAIRPSGTEPKVKLYFSTNVCLDRLEDYPQKIKVLENKIENLSQSIHALF